ncbi:tetratricopeptide repeat protein [Natronosporangium hydrolyticum]|uniref:Tetratricopeptide repeat protein n=1 Tax=Natronosporangium hydrolyticum TaxID=2811111 RepID=A0A895YH73_9ACTN|nr:tetratricopeptide repeat protein [Natronosporangium hydrolyticum]QSB14869.1 tetratricopeptide repeat protein [Natronosporangium hydrolyticum]
MAAGSGAGTGARFRDRLSRPVVAVPLATGLGAFAVAVGSLLADQPVLASALAAAGTGLTAWAAVRGSIRAQQPVDAAMSSVSDGPMWRLPHRLQLFTGRATDLAKLTTTLASGRRPDLVALTGMGGVGKTSLALEYAHRRAPETSLTAWIPATDRASVVTALAALGGELGVAADDPEAAARATLDQLVHREPWLLVYDDATPPAVADLLPTTGDGEVVLTSRREDWSSWAQLQPVAPFLGPDAVRLLLDRSGDASPNAAGHAAALAAMLGHLPLAVDLAGGYCRRYRITLAAYISLWRERGLSMMPTDESQVLGPNEVATRLSSDRLARGDLAAVQLLRLLSVLAPGQLPQEVLTADPSELPEPLATAATEPTTWHALLTRVADAGLIRVQPGRLWVHHLVQEVQRDAIRRGAPVHRRLLRWRRDPTARWPLARWATLAVRLITAQFPEERHRVELWQRCSELRPHAEALLADGSKWGVAQLDTARLAYRVATYRYDTGDGDAAAELLTGVLGDYRAVLGDEHPDTHRCLNNLALVEHGRGGFDTASALLTAVLDTYRRSLGEDHPDSLGAMNNLALVRHDQGDLDRAGELYAQVLTARRRVLGDDHPDTIASVNNLGTLRRAQGDLDAAATLHTQALDAFRRTLGDDHPDTARALSNLGTLRRAQGDLDAAATLHTQALDAFRRILGDGHPHTVTATNNLVEVLTEQGDDSTAHRLRQRLSLPDANP